MLLKCVVNIAVPELSVAVPSAVEPWKNVTVPVAAEGETVAVKATSDPGYAVVEELDNDVEVDPLPEEFTASATELDVLEA